MNKQQLAAKIWASANKMRSKIEANEYKDYILGFIFYKFLSDKEVDFLKNQGISEKEMPSMVVETNKDVVEFCQKNIGYFISYENLNSTWLDPNFNFTASCVSTALSAFSRLISPNHKKVFDGIFKTLDTGLSKLGGTKEVNDLLQLLRDIPTDSKQDYDVLGFIYEYLISNFAANAGKKAGEFYTPHEVASLMAEIVANHSKNKRELSIYDPTSGSGSLLINIGRSVSKYTSKEKVKYYAQELKENTYNLTRMNLVMRGITPDNIVTRNADTLEDDWPLFDENDKENTYEHLLVDAVVSNPPYSQAWSPENKENDPRYNRFGLAPKGKADYAFLLHDLYHIKPDGIMTIVLPHGVLFRGNEEEQIRKNLIESNNIDTIIGLPANIFFGTGIPTIIMVLKQKRDNSDVLIIDASKGYEKVGKNNKLRASDIMRIADVVASRISVPKFSKVVSRDEIRQNGYNLNIPRYVDSSEKAESWDIYASMFGGIPNAEIDELNDFWTTFPTLRTDLFKQDGTPISALKSTDIMATIRNNADVKAFVKQYEQAFANNSNYLETELVKNAKNVEITKEEDILKNDLFTRMKEIRLIDRYQAYQLLDNQWQIISSDLEMIQSEGYGEATRKVDPNMVIKKKDNKEVEVQEGWKGHIMPFDLVQQTLLIDEYKELKRCEEILANNQSEFEEIFTQLNEDVSEKITDDDGKLVKEKFNKLVDDILDGISTPEIKILEQYNALSQKAEKIAFIEKHSELFSNLPKGKDGTVNKTPVTSKIKSLRLEYQFDDDSEEAPIMNLYILNEQSKVLNAEVKKKSDDLHEKTKSTIESLTDKQIALLLHKKWDEPYCDALAELPMQLIASLTTSIKSLAEKYAVTYADLAAEGEKAEIALSSMIDELTGSDFDMKGLKEFQSTLKSE